MPCSVLRGLSGDLILKNNLRVEKSTIMSLQPPKARLVFGLVFSFLTVSHFKLSFAILNLLYLTKLVIFGFVTSCTAPNALFVYICNAPCSLYYALEGT